MAEATHYCRTCEQDLPADRFYPYRTYQCKACQYEQIEGTRTIQRKGDPWARKRGERIGADGTAAMPDDEFWSRVSATESVRFGS